MTSMAEHSNRRSRDPAEIARDVAQALAASLTGRVTADSFSSPSLAPTPLPAGPRQQQQTQHQTPFGRAAAAPRPPSANPTQATAYISMLPYAYTNNDVAQLFSPFGKLARVTILRDKQTRRSRGVAFVQFARVEDCQRAVAGMHDTELEGRRLACSVCRDNGRSNEFLRKRKYAATAAPATGASNGAQPSSVTPAQPRCFECGEYGHFSYDCPRNVLGARERPVHRKKLKKKKRFDLQERGHYFNDEGTTNLLAPPRDMEEDISLSLLAYPSTGTVPEFAFAGGLASARTAMGKRITRKAGSYFSDESGSDDEDGDAHDDDERHDGTGR